MKPMWLHPMLYIELPENFQGKHPSVWVDSLSVGNLMMLL